ncbi:hypothetical protein [Aeoliella sp. SH292]|uniref:hypothetical protein n=1 Tax=Aeoliella sp. SH292 TaxID=3454464 RepID=UPI003F97AEF0
MIEHVLDQLETLTPGGYATGGTATAEPTAWAALALARAGRNDSAERAARWLAIRQQHNGAVPASATADGPYWTTSLAVMAWHESNPELFEAEIAAAVRWLLADKGDAPARKAHIGHDTSIVGWSWAIGTHSWLEPTSFATMALKQAGYADHPRTREAVRLLVDRLLPAGGANYGNTIVLGQELLPHLQPSAIAMQALAGEELDDPRIERSLTYIEQQLAVPTGVTSLAHALMALAAWKRSPANFEELVAEALERRGVWVSTYKLALLALAQMACSQAPALSYPEPQLAEPAL